MTTTVILAAVVVICFTSSIIVSNILDNRKVTAHEQGFWEGSIQGYEVGFKEGSKAGYQEGSKAGYEKAEEENPNSDSDYGVGFHFTYNPTYNEVREILAESIETTAMEVNNYAETNGLRTAYVRCQIAREAPERSVFIYNVVAFVTADNEFIFIRPRTYEKIRVEVGKSYSELNGFPKPDYDDTITKITIFW
jgi:hypothetical protein